MVGKALGDFETLGADWEVFLHEWRAGAR